MEVFNLTKYRYRTVLIIICAITIIFLAVFIFIKYSIQKSVQQLQAYEYILISEKSNSGNLQGEIELTEFLNEMEEYISSNQHRLFIKNYSKSTTLIAVEFYFGFSYVVMPIINGS